MKAVSRTEGARLGHMQPVLDPDPKDGHKKLLLVCSAFLAIFVLIAVVAALAAP